MPATYVNDKWLRKVTACLILFFPTVSVLIRHGATGTYTGLILIGLFFGWKGRHRLTVMEKVIFVGFGLYFLSGAVSLLNTEHFKIGFSRMERYARFIVFIPAYMAVKHYRIQLLKVIPYGLEMGALFIFVTAIYQLYSQHLERAGGIVTSIMFGDIAALVAALLVIGAVFDRQNVYRKMLDYGLAAMAITAAYFSGTRNAWLVVPELFVLLLIVLRQKVSRLNYLALSVGCLLVIYGLFNLHATNRLRWENSLFKGVKNTISFFKDGPSPKNTSSNFRLNMWRNSLILFKRHPLLGVGLGDYQAEMKALVDSGESYLHQRVLYRHTAHSIYFHSLAITGLIGFSCMLLGLILLPLYTFKRMLASSSNPSETYAAVSGIMVICAYALFGVGETWTANHAFICTYLIFLMIFMTGGSMAFALHPETKALAVEPAPPF